MGTSELVPLMLLSTFLLFEFKFILFEQLLLYTELPTKTVFLS